MILLRSGYRKTETHELCLNVNYETAPHNEINRTRLLNAYKAEIDSAIRENPEFISMPSDEATNQLTAKVQARLKLEGLTFEIVVFARDIQSVGYFDLDLFEEHFSPNAGAHEEGEVSSASHDR